MVDLQTPANQLTDYVTKFGTELDKFGIEIAFILLPVVLSTYFGVQGLLIIGGQQRLGNVFWKVSQKTLILAIILVLAWPQSTFRNAIKDLPKASNELGIKLIQAAGLQVQGNNPGEYWLNWITTGDKEGDGGKFGMDYIFKNIYGCTQIKAAYYDVNAVLFGLLGVCFTLSVIPTIALGTSAVIFVAAIYFGLMGPWLAALVTVAAAMTGSMIVVVFFFLGGYVGPFVVLNLVLPLGIAVMPLIYFDGFERLWQDWMKFLIGTLVTVVAFYIASALGYVIVEGLVQVLFHSGILAQIIGPALTSFVTAHKDLFGPVGQAIEICVSKLQSSSSGVTTPNKDTFVVNLMLAFIGAPLWIAGSGIIGLLVVGGTSIGATAGSIGYSWAQGFASTQVIEGINGAFALLRAGTQNTIGIAAQEGLRAGASTTKGAMKFGRGLYRWGKSRFR